MTDHPVKEVIVKPFSRRGFVRALVAVAAAIPVARSAFAKKGKSKSSDAAAASSDAPAKSWAAKPPESFVPMSKPGIVVKATKPGTLQPNGLWPTEDAARTLLARAMLEFTGEKEIGPAFAKFVHPGDKVAIKVNGIGGQKGATMGTNKELVAEIVKGVIAAGIPATEIWVFDQYRSFLAGTRVTEKSLPAGVRCMTHDGTDAEMPEFRVHGTRTRFCRQLTDATAVINVALIKDHSQCGYTGTLKNMTHGCVLNPDAFHTDLMNPQIPLLYSQEAIRSRVRLHITDAFKVMFNGGPLDKDKNARVPFDSVYVATDPVAMDMIGWQVVEKFRAEKKMPTLKKAKREPAYIMMAGELGLGIADMNRIVLKEVTA